jgi:ribosomal protein S12 methylthiotransferase accessory factor
MTVDEFLKFPRIKANLQLECISSSELFVRDEDGARHLFQGAVFVHLCGCLQESLSHEEILKRTFDQFSPEEVYYALYQLKRQGIICEEEKSAHIPPEWFSLLETFSLTAIEATKKLQNCPIGFEAVNAEDLSDALRFFEKYPFMREAQPKLKIVIADHYRRKELFEWSRRAKEENAAWLLLKVSGPKGWLGPLFAPDKPPCYECLKAALDRNQLEMIWAEKKLGRDQPLPEKAHSIPFIRDTLFARAAFEAFRWILAPKHSKLEGNLATLDFTEEMQFHRVIPQSSCSCARFGASSQTAIAKDHQPIQSFDGGYRTIDPELTWEKYKHLISPITGYIQKVELSSDQYGSFVFIAEHNPIKNFSEELLKAGKYRNCSSGKGRAPSQARTGALCEALERISGVYQGKEQVLRASYNELGPQAIHPNEVDLFSENQYRIRGAWNEKRDSFNIIPRPLDPDEPTDWTALDPLNHQRQKWLPTASCYFAYPPDPIKGPFAIGNSNGCAAGNTLEEAILQGLFELIERDSAAIWWYNQLQRKEVDLSSFQNRYFEKSAQWLKAKGREIWVLDLTFDLEVPAFAAISTKDGQQLLMGLGAHLDPEIAISRAISELFQTVGAKNKEFVSALKLTETQERAAYFYPKGPKKTKKDYIEYRPPTVQQALLDVIEPLQRKNLEVFILNQTRAEIGLPVVRTVVPGLRHFWRRLAPGRLYEIPYQLGLIPRIFSEDELNPQSIIF